MNAGLSGSRPSLESCFLPTERGEIHITAWLPASGAARNWLLLVPPFAEELNKSRRMLAMLGRRAAIAGHAVVLADFSGTGDSWGDFRDARYACWQGDLTHTVRWAEQRGGAVTHVLGMRFGSLLAADLAARHEPIRHVVLWQPALSGADVLSQFLRLKTAAALTGSGGAGDSVEAIRAQLTGGEAVEIAGYELTAELYSAIGAIRLPELFPARGLTVDWFHLVRQADGQVPAAIVAAASKLAERGTAVQTHAVHGDAFWSTAEIAVCEALVEQTVACLAP